MFSVDRRRLLLGLLLPLLLLPVRPAAAQARVQELTGTIDDANDLIFYDLYDLPAGHTLYVYAAATSGNLDTYLMLGDIDFQDIYQEDDDGGGGTNSALEYLITEGGDYTLAITRYDETTAGDFRLLIGLDAPEVMTGRAAPTGHELAVYYGALPLGAYEVTDCSRLAERPVLSGPEQRLETDYFVLHYTVEGRDAATPDFAREVSRMLDRIWKREVLELGWPPPPTDCGEGGDTRYDIYLMDILDEGMLGYSTPESVLGDNPLSHLPEEWAAYSYLVIDNDFSGYRDPFAIMLTTAVHEFNHSIQFGYDIADAGGEWYYEATAVWMETQAFPEVEDATPYVPDLFAYPDLCIGSTPDDPAHDARIYAEWLLIDSLAQDYGPGVVRRLWELIAIYEGMDSFYQLLDELGTTPQAVMQRLAVRNLLLDYDLAASFPGRVRVESVVNGFGQFGPSRSGVQELGVDYVLVTKPLVYTFAVEPPTLTLTLVGVDLAASAAYVFDLGGRGTVDTTPFDFTYLIILNTGVHRDTGSCTMTDWALTVSDGSAESPSQPEGKIWDAAHFVPAS